MGKQTELNIRLLTEDDIPFAVCLKELAGWNQIEDDWGRYLTYEPGGCFIGELHGRAAGTVTTTTYQNRSAWIGMLLVHPDMRRRGLGKALLEHAIRYIEEQGVQTIKLDATPMGKKVYIPLGFVDEYTIRRYKGSGGLSGEEKIDLIDQDDLALLSRFDEPYFGASRERVLNELRGAYPQYSLVIKDNSGIVGYAMARKGSAAFHIGPLVAEDPLVAERLLRALLQRLPKEEVILDVPAPNTQACEMVEKYSFEVQRTLDRMYLGENKYPGCIDKIFATASPAKG